MPSQPALRRLVSYGGGERVVVLNTCGKQRIQFEAGDLVMYPGTSLHRVEPVTRGKRLSARPASD